MISPLRSVIVVAATFLPGFLHAQDLSSNYVRDHYSKRIVRIPMRDGVKLHTIIYAPKDLTQPYPMLMKRTPYGIAPYEEGAFPKTLGPNPHFTREKFIFVSQDVRGRYMSEGTFENMRPHQPKRSSNKDIDESTDTYDTIDWLIKNVDNHNGKVGLYGISYPGFYTAAGMIDAHPALKAASPQAPIADWFFDDFYHHGAFFLPHAFNFFARFGHPRPMPTTKSDGKFTFPTPDGYKFFLELGPLKNADAKHFKGDIAFWKTLMEHNTYDAFWKERNLLPHLKKVAPAVMVVGGWYDAEDLYGIFNTYQTVEKQNPNVFNMIVIGPWAHGAWSRADATRLGQVHFGANTAAWYQKEVELPFFNHFLKGKGDHKLPEALMFETGNNRWRRFDHWPPKNLEHKTLYFQAQGKLNERKPGDSGSAFKDEFPSDPKRPVPFTEAITTGMTQEYMTDDQRFANRRPDVLVFQTEPLAQDLTLAGPISAHLHVATTQTDADWIVKVIDVFPDDAVDKNLPDKKTSGYHMHVRSEVLRGRFRNSYEKPEPFTAHQPDQVRVPLQDVLHTFKKGHRLQVQVHSTWFPLVDRNPQKYVPNIFYANDQDFTAATHTVFRSQDKASGIRIGVLKE
jgi:hypothetical protein